MTLLAVWACASRQIVLAQSSPTHEGLRHTTAPALGSCRGWRTRTPGTVDVDITDQRPQQVTEQMLRGADLVVVLGRDAQGRDAQLEPVEGTPVEVWDTDEPSERGIDGLDRMRLVRSDIHHRVSQLACRLRHPDQAGSAPTP